MSQLNPISQKRTLNMLLSAMGGDIRQALDDNTVTDILVNPDGKLWLDRHGPGREDTGEILSVDSIERILRLVASHTGRDVDTANPIISAELPNIHPFRGERFEGLIPPVVTAPCFSIRRGAAQIYSLDDYVTAGTMTEGQADALKHATTSRKNILIVGGTGSGKTTLANALLAEIAAYGERILILEDTRELQYAAPDTVALRTSSDINMAALVRSTLRLRPDRIIIGEVRGAEALDMLKAWNTGHPGGLATIHANSGEAGLARLEQLILEGITSIPHSLIAEAIDVIVFIKGRGAARRIETVSQLTGMNGFDYQLEPICPKFKPALSLISTQPSTKGD